MDTELLKTIFPLSNHLGKGEILNYGLCSIFTKEPLEKYNTTLRISRLPFPRRQV